MARWAGVFLLGIFLRVPSFADVGLIMNESTGLGVSGFTSAGHSAVYLSSICPASPVKVRLCEPGEQGSVVSNYTNLGESEPYEWNIVPLSVYLYGVERMEDAPLYGNTEALRLLQEQYRERHLTEICPLNTCGNPKASAHWRDMVGAAFVRTVYLFQVKTTEAEDAELVAAFNSEPNENHYNGITRNCADFARSVLNRYFPGSAKPDRLNDFGMTSPKAISKSFSRYGEKHPELNFSAERFDQLPGTIKRSSPCRKGTEVSFRMKKWFIPLVLARSHELPFFLAAYGLTGRFNPDAEVRRHPAEDVRATMSWRSYQKQFGKLLSLDERSVDAKNYFKELDEDGRVELDQDGRPVLELGGRRVGLTRSNILAPGSDPEMAYWIVFARVQSVLSLPVHRREPLANFEKDWELLWQLRESNTVATN
jgi:hypothetical protein